MDYQPSYGFLKDCLYRSESYKVTLADAYNITPCIPSPKRCELNGNAWLPPASSSPPRPLES
ncbi:hypothetical protein SAMN04490208_1113 [Pseudomonas poae]|uniref:Uncharacterized protein n=1 Tax=Pseudomonas poae TaxID=200451 RepID=A0ABY0RCY2_9PSED|nr:hypothetical protein SAMN04490208_1113 [Pseudomonas poae]